MALPRKGTRRITVDGEDYRWAIRKKLTYSQGAFATPMTFAVEFVEAPHRTLLVTTTIPRPDNCASRGRAIGRGMEARECSDHSSAPIPLPLRVGTIS